MFESFFAKTLYNFFNFFTHRIFYQNACCKCSVFRKIKMRILIRKGIEKFLLPFGNDSSFILHYKMVTSDNHFFIIDRRRDTVRNNVVYICMHFFMKQTFFLRGINNSTCNRVGKMFLKASCFAKKFIFRFTIKRYKFNHSGFCFCKCSRFIKNNRVRFGYRFQESASLNGNAVFCCFFNCRQHRYGHCHLKST